MQEPVTGEIKDQIEMAIGSLADEIDQSTVETSRDSKAVLVIGAQEITFNAEMCRTAFHSVDTVQIVFEAAGSPETAYLSLYDVVVEQDVEDTLERLFTAVDSL